MKSLLKDIVVSILTWEAKILLRRAKPKIIAITGNVGKTTTKDAVYHVLKDHVKTRKSEKSYNSEIGVPLSVLGLSNAWGNPFLWAKNIFDGLLLALFPGDYAEVVVLEMGVDRPGDMAKLTEWVKPDVVVLTRLPDVPVHVEYFATPEAVREEKMELVHALKPDGVFVYNNDDEQVRQVVETVRQKSFGYGRYAPTQFTASGDSVVYQGDVPVGLACTITHGSESDSFELQGAIGVQHTYNQAAACAVASIFDISISACAEALRTYTSPPGRMRVIPGLKQTTLIDDTYNSSPVAAEWALSALYELQGAKRKIAVLGDMLELGQFSVREHERVGQQVADGADMLITVGVRARGIAEGAMNFGMDEANILQFDESVRAGRELQGLMKAGDVVLIKGSQGVRMEKIVEDVMAEPKKASDLLVRQSTVWRQKA